MKKKIIREVDLTNTRWRCSFQKQEMSRNYSGFWLSIPLSAHFWKALAILFLAPSWKKYVQSSYWETTADSLLILFSALSCHPGSHQKKTSSGQNSKQQKLAGKAYKIEPRNLSQSDQKVWRPTWSYWETYLWKHTEFDGL